MIIRNNKLILEASREVLKLVDEVQQKTQQRIGAIYKGSQLIWLTIYNAIKSCFGSGTWLGDKPWIGTDPWKKN